MPASRRPRRPPPEPRPGFIAVGEILATRGVRGELKVRPLTDFPQRFAPGAVLWAGPKKHAVRSARTHRDTVLLQLEGVDDHRGAEALRGLLLEVPESELTPLVEDQYYRFQLIGMAVLDAAGAPLGRLEEVLETGGNDVYLVRNAEGELLIPAIDTVVRQVDVEARRMIVDLPAGLERRRVATPKRRRRPAARRGDGPYATG